VRPYNMELITRLQNFGFKPICDWFEKLRDNKKSNIKFSKETIRIRKLRLRAKHEHTAKLSRLGMIKRAQLDKLQQTL